VTPVFTEAFVPWEAGDHHAAIVDEAGQDRQRSPGCLKLRTRTA
jgi:hypothetical protein